MKRLLAGGVGIAAMAACAVALADGGRDIASAPDLPVGQVFANGVDVRPANCLAEFPSPVEYWRLPVEKGDLVIIDYKETVGTYAGVFLYPPDVTDATFAARCGTPTVRQAGYGPGELVWTAPAAGRWVVALEGDGYEMLALVQHQTSVSLTVPRTAKKGRTFAVRGAVAGPSEGTIQILVTGAGQTPKQQRVKLRSGGAFSASVRLTVRGTYKVRAIYAGDISHRPSDATRTTRVS